ncbi:MAG TPA: Gfo/Idh/MocA family oxidoreductase [Gemmatimonadaceae bacterium]|nr:Gfo/Idh/MocA family oxidoreductase [Gemmatimonadaceae bacterium]
MRTVRWGIIGCGDVTEVKSGPALQQARNSALVAVMRRTGTLARDYAERHGVPRWYDDADALIHDPEVDAVYIATPPSSHREYTLRSAAAGKPVYVEKPMALGFKECESMIAACRAAGVPLFVAYYRRALPRFLQIRELVQSGAIGDVRFVNVTLHEPPAPNVLAPASLPWRVRPEISGGGLFVDLASHMLDFLDFTLGPIREARGLASNQAHLYPAEDIVSGAFRFESGVQGVGSWCFCSFEKQDRTEIIGSRGRITYVTFDSSPIVLETALGRRELAIANPPHIQQPLIQLVVDELNGCGTSPSTGESAARTSRVMDQLLASVRPEGARPMR